MDEQMNVGLQEELLADLTVELEDEPTFSSSKLEHKIINAIREVKRARKYPVTYTEEQIEKDIYNFYSNIRNIALYDFNQIGIEFQVSSSENGTTRAYLNRAELFDGIIPIAKL